MIDLADFADEQTAPNPDKLDKLAGYASRMGEIEAELEQLAKRAKDLNEEHHQISTQKIPDMFQELGVSEIALAAGGKVKVADFLRPPSMGADSAMRMPMIRWLEEQGLDDVVKDTITVPFGKGETKKATEFERELREKNVDFSRLRTVNSQTLGATLREIREAKKITIPYDRLGIQVGKIAKVTR